MQPLILNPYLIFDGNAQEAFDFYRSIFGGDFSFQLTAEQSPASPEHPLDPAEKDKLMHICLPLPGGQILQASDMIHSYCNGADLVFLQGNTQFIAIRTDSEQDARQIFSGLSEGATVQQALQPMFWGDLFGQLTDQFGVQWMISVALKKP
jgi:PhnB protein